MTAKAITVRPFGAEDGEAASSILARCFAGFEDELPGVRDALDRGLATLAQLGSRFLIAETDGAPAGVLRLYEDEGLGSFDLLCSSVPGAGRALIAAAERASQDRGIRLLRTVIPDFEPYPAYFSRKGYLPIGRSQGPRPLLTVEKRLPLLTVREQRRSDAAAIASLTGEDPWPFEQGHRPGWFVLSDGERVAGAVSVRVGAGGAAVIRPPVVAAGYDQRGLEVWMVSRVAIDAATHGAITASVAATPELDAYEREFEDRRWFREGAEYRRELADIPLSGDDPWR